MAFELKPGQGSLFQNDKQGNEQRPDYRGTVNIDGTLYELSGWKKRSKNQVVWVSLSAKVQERRESGGERSPSRREDGVDEDIPF